MALPIIINGQNFGDILEYTTRSETFRKVQGGNAGVSIGGTQIYDDIAVKYDLHCTTKPCSPARLQLLQMQIIQSPVTVTYFSFWRNQQVTQQMRCDGAEALIGILRNDIATIKNITLDFIQK